MSRIQINQKPRVRQYIVFDVSNMYYTESYTALKNRSLADWQQQMTTTHTYLYNVGHESVRLHTNTYNLLPLPFIDNYNPYYPEPNYGFDPYWDVHLYNQYPLFFYHNFDKQEHELEQEFHEADQALNIVFANTRVDTWQTKCDPIGSPL